VKPTYGLSEDDMERMLLDAYEHGEEDIRARRLLEERVDATRITQALEAALHKDGALITDEEERLDIEGSLQRLKRAVAGDDPDEIHRRTEDLDLASKAFAGRRMDRSMAQALSGRSAGELESETRAARGIEPHLGTESH